VSVFKRSPQKIPVRDLKGRSLSKLSREAAAQDPCVRLSVQGVFKRSPQKIPVRDLKGRSLFELSRQDLSARSLLS